jgi:hypothetical protein
MTLNLPQQKTVRILRHSHCFDGFCSAAIFARFYRDYVDPNATFRHRGLSHNDPGPIDSAHFDSDVHAIVDFRYSDHPKLDWWFDHHRSAFPTPEDRAHFHRHQSTQRQWDPKAPSCAGFIAKKLEETHGFDPRPIASIVHWADIIDAARFPTPEFVVRPTEPALQLMHACAHLDDGTLAEQVIAGLAAGDIKAVARLPMIQELFATLQHNLDESMVWMKTSMERTKVVAFVNYEDRPCTPGLKFAPYLLEPDMTYAIAMTKGAGFMKLLVGSNPWRPEARKHDISKICERYGGGGHAVVGGISLPNASPEDGMKIAREIIQTLTESPS